MARLSTSGEAPWAELMAYLDGLYATLKELTALADRKLDGLRSANADALHRCAAEESELLQNLFRSAQGRAALLARLAQALHQPDLRGVPLNQLADRLPEPRASTLRAKNVALQSAATELQRRNRISATVAQQLLGHLRGVFDELAQATQEAVGYGPQGKVETCSMQCWVDAVG